jgi:Protein of unknown function (DUF3489)
MTTFTIDSDDHMKRTTGTQKDEGLDQFSSLDELGQLAEPWPAARLVRIWNSLPSATAVKRFTDRKTAVSRIWKALQNEGGDSSAKTKLRRKNGARSTKPTARAGTRKAHIIRLLERPNGASVAEIMRATDWQPHTVRGFISRALVHDLGLQVARFKREKGQPAYRLQRQKRD